MEGILFSYFLIKRTYEIRTQHGFDNRFGRYEGKGFAFVEISSKNHS